VRDARPANFCFELGERVFQLFVIGGGFRKGGSGGFRQRRDRVVNIKVVAVVCEKCFLV
jgi:hypothetical protein